MKKLLLSMALAATLATPAAAQWVTDPSQANPVTPDDVTNYGYETATTKGGATYVYTQVPTAANTLEMRLQIIDRDGYKTQDIDGILLSDYPNLTFTMVNQHLMVDNDGNAIVAVYDFRTGNGAYTIYKATEEGDTLWHHTLDAGNANGNSATMSMACSADGGYVFAYESWADDGSTPILCKMFKLDANGNDVWGGAKVLKDPDGQQDYAYPYLVDAGNSQTMLIHAQGTNQDLIAQLYNADGSLAWDEETYVYSGGFVDGMPLHTMLNVFPGPDGGAFVAWIDADNSTGTMENRLSYIHADGTYGFTTGEEGTNISNDNDYTRQVPDHLYYDAAEKAAYVIYRQYSQTLQNYQGVYAQKLSLEGELLWGASGKALIALQETGTYNYLDVQGATEGRVAFFYMYQDNSDGSYLGPVRCVMELRDKDGNQVQAPVEFATSKALKYSLEMTPLIDGQYYLATWSETNADGNDVVYMQRVYLNGKLTAIEKVDADKAKAPLRKEYYSVGGQRLSVPGKGVGIVRNVYADHSTSTVKLNK